jgi:ABC-type polysaccharide/polyol phosphate export permease
MTTLLRRLIANRNLLKNLVIRDLKHRYVGSIGGFMWSVIHPLVSFVSYTFVFTVIFNNQLGPEFGTDSYAIFFFCGFLPWFLFSDTIMRNCNAISDNAPLITKTIIPPEILPISITISNFVHHIIGLAILLVVMMLFYSIHFSALWIVLYIGMTLMLAQGLGWIVAGLHVFVRDTIQGLQILMFLWFWFTPVLYPLTRLPPEYRPYAELNPMAIIVTGYRNSILHLAQPDFAKVAIVLGTSILIFVIGAVLFRQAKPAFPDVL